MQIEKISNVFSDRERVESKQGNRNPHEVIITTNHFLRIKSRKMGRKLGQSDHRIRAAAAFIKANRLGRALHELEMALKISDEIDACLDELWARGKVEKQLHEEFNKINK